MALVICPECASKVSGQATACPQCGHPLEAESAPKVQAVAETGVATASAKTCPRCRKAVDSRAYKCPYCKKALRTSPVTWGCLALILFVVVMVILTNQISRRAQTPSEVSAQNAGDVDQSALPRGSLNESKTAEARRRMSEKKAQRAKQVQVDREWLREIGFMDHWLERASDQTILVAAANQRAMREGECGEARQYMERLGYYLTAWKLGRHYRTYDAYVQDEVEDALASAADFERGPIVLGTRGTRDDHTPAFLVEDGHYVSARWPGDSYLVAQRFGERLRQREASEDGTALP